MGFRKHSKVRTGCITCKARRVKCDETKPICVRCAASGRHCEGYRTPRAWLFESEKERGLESAVREYVPKALPPTTAPPAERRAFLFFTERTVRVLCPFSEATSKFWLETIPMLSLSEDHKPLWHVLAATASNHEIDSCVSENAPQLRRFSTHQYSQAVKELTKIPVNPQVLLLSSCLFTTCENFRAIEYPNTDGLIHVKAGLKILRSLPHAVQTSDPSAGPTDNIIADHVAPSLGQVELLMSMFNTPRWLRLPASPPGGNTLLAKPPLLPTHFTDLANAQHCFIQLCRWRYHSCFNNSPACPSLPPASSRDPLASNDHSWTKTSRCFTHFLELLKQWHHLLLSYKTSLKPERHAENHRAGVMLRQYRLLYLAFHASVDNSSTTEEGYDETNSMKRITPLMVDLSDPSLLCVEIPVNEPAWKVQVHNRPQELKPSPDDIDASSIFRWNRTGTQTTMYKLPIVGNESSKDTTATLSQPATTTTSSSPSSSSRKNDQRSLASPISIQDQPAPPSAAPSISTSATSSTSSSPSSRRTGTKAQHHHADTLLEKRARENHPRHAGVIFIALRSALADGATADVLDQLWGTPTFVPASGAGWDCT